MAHMKIKDAIKKLQELDPEMELVAQLSDSSHYCNCEFLETVMMYLRKAESELESDIYYVDKPSSIKAEKVEVAKFD